MPGDEQRQTERRQWTMLTFTDAAQRLVDENIVRSMTAEGLRKLARTHPEWPLTEEDYGRVAGVRLVPYERVVEFIQTRSTRSGRGPDLQPRKQKPRQTPPSGRKAGTVEDPQASKDSDAP